MRSQNEDEQSLDWGQLQRLNTLIQPVLFDWKNRWLKGHEYEYILRNCQAYCKKFNLQKLPRKTHPPEIYQRPISITIIKVDGTLYFVQGNGLGSQFGFPRVQAKKKFRWKKMNFPTNLPKTNPRVTYIVASTTNSHQINQIEQPLFRMHAVIPYQQQSRQTCGYILCHILQIKKKNDPQQLNSCLLQYNFDFYKLFAFLHNASIARQ